jgi:hypothetical protein
MGFDFEFPVFDFFFPISISKPQIFFSCLVIALKIVGILASTAIGVASRPLRSEMLGTEWPLRNRIAFACVEAARLFGRAALVFPQLKLKYY